MGSGRKLKSHSRSIQVWPLIEGIHTFPFRRGDISNDPVCLKQTKPLPFSAVASLCVAEHALSGLWNMKLLCPHFTYSTDLHHILSPPLSACSSLAPGLVALFFSLFFFCLSHPHSVLSFRVLSSQSSFISRISLPEPPQPEMSQSLASFPPMLPL